MPVPDVAKPYSIEALNNLSFLSSLLIKFGGKLPKLSKCSPVWFRAKIGGVPATPTNPTCDLIEPAKGYFLFMAALASELEGQMVKCAYNHGAPHKSHGE